MSRGAWFVAAYPPSFRARYGPELAALLEDSGTGPGVLVDVLLGALRAWLRPAYGVDPREGRRLRMTSTVSTVWVSWCVVLCGTLGTLRLLEDPAAPGLTLGTEAWRAFHQASTVAFAAGLLLIAMAGVPLGLRVLRTSRGARRTLLGPVVAGVAVGLGFVVVALWAVSLLPDGPGGARTPWLFGLSLVAWTVLTAATATWWTFAVPKALREAGPDVHALRLPVVLGVPLAVVLVVPSALLVSVAWGTGLGWGIGYAVVSWLFVAVVVGAAAACLVSAGRGMLALRRPVG